MARARGLGKAGRQRIAEMRSELLSSRNQFALTSDEGKDALGFGRDNFDAWTATDQTTNNEKDLKNLGERTNGQSSTRIISAQYFFDRKTLTGDILVEFRGQSKRTNPPFYAYTNIPAAVAKRFMTALSKGKTINFQGFTGTYSNEGALIRQRPPATPFGAEIQKGNYGNVPPTGLKKSNFLNLSTMDIPQQSDEGPAQGTLF